MVEGSIWHFYEKETNLFLYCNWLKFSIWNGVIGKQPIRLKHGNLGVSFGQSWGKLRVTLG